MIYILTISNINTPDSDEIERLVKIHTSPNISVVKSYVNEELPGGFTIEKKDDLLTNIIKHDEHLRKSIDEPKLRIIAEEKAILKRQAKYAQDTSITEGASPYEPIKPRNI